MTMRMKTINEIHLDFHFERVFGTRPRVFRAPGRVNLIGEHTDYNDGFVMPAAVGFSTYVAIAPRQDRKLVVHSEEFPGNFEFDLDHLPEKRVGAWCDYVLGVASVLRQQGRELAGANLLVQRKSPDRRGTQFVCGARSVLRLRLLKPHRKSSAAAGSRQTLPPGGKQFCRREGRHHGSVCLLHGKGGPRFFTRLPLA